MSRVTPLFELQQVDSNLDRHNATIANIEASLADNSLQEAARQAVAEADNELRKVRITLKELEFESQTTEKHATDLEAKLYGGQIKGVKEMQAAQTEIDTYRQRRKELEDKSVEAMLEVEEAETVLQSFRQKLVEVEAEWEKATAALRQERDKLQGELGQLQLEREKQAKKVPPADLPVYEKLRAQKQGVAVAEVMQGKYCGKCRVDFAMAKQRELKSPVALVTCPSCGRILYLQ